MLKAAILSFSLMAAPLPHMTAELEQPAVLRAGLDIDASAVGESGPILDQRIRSKADQVRLAAEVLPARGPGDPTMKLVVRPLPGEEMGYELESSLARGDEVLDFETVQCRLCTEGELVEQAEAAVNRLVAKLKAAGQRPRPSNGEVEPEPEPSRGSKNDGSPLGLRGKVGIGLLVPGAVGLATGIALVALPDKVKEENPLEKWRFWPVGIGVTVAGAALVVTGAVLLALDRKRARSSATTFAPFLLDHGTGFVLERRF